MRAGEKANRESCPAVCLGRGRALAEPGDEAGFALRVYLLNPEMETLNHWIIQTLLMARSRRLVLGHTALLEDRSALPWPSAPCSGSSLLISLNFLFSLFSPPLLFLVLCAQDSSNSYSLVLFFAVPGEIAVS